MKCQKCGADIPEGKIYCEQCGSAIQMVPDYNPVDDIAIGEAVKKKENTVIEKSESTPKEVPYWICQWKYWAAAIVLVVIGFV